ncbi:MAG: hypothetical protein KAW12_30765 [Candidatus Aminicenantes bacterium]|nr:hypothetical protein [Candidatus Aminicenantes bacterium]
MNTIAKAYVKLAFNLEKHDRGYVDFYFGPEALKQEAQKENKTLNQIKTEAAALIEKLENFSLKNSEQLLNQRLKSLIATLFALKVRAEMKSGKKFTFDEESKALFGAVSPTFPDDYYENILGRLDALLPGKESGKNLTERYEDFRKQFIVPPEKVDAVFKAAIDEGRKRTKEHIQLPENENFLLEYVKDKPWGAYNWFKGDAVSLIQLNTDLPIYIDRALDLACHEGYPGHHVFSTLVEQKLYKEKIWLEFSIYPLYCPQSLLMEGTANFGIEVAFPPAERLKFEKEVLVPLAGIDPGQLETYYRVLELTGKLSYARNDTVRLYFEGKIEREEAIKRLMQFQLVTRDRAQKSLRFVEIYGSYIINYNLGEDMVRAYIEKRGGTADNPEKRWQEFKKLLSTPLLPEDLEK